MNGKKRRKGKRRAKKQKHAPIKNADIGTVLIHSLVENSETKEEDRIVLNAIKDSVWSVYESRNTLGAKVHWAAAGILAAYNLGKTGINIPTGKKKAESS